MFIVKGLNLGDCGTTVANSFPLGTTMGRTSIRISVGPNTFDAPMVYVVACRQGGPDQLAAILPSNTMLGPASLTVTYNGRTSAVVRLQVVPASFGVFSINQAGNGPGVFTDPNYVVKTNITPARPGDLLFIWGTGLGAGKGPDNAAPVAGDLDLPVEVYVGNQKAEVSYHGRSGCCAGLDQILFKVPDGAQGCNVAVTVRVNGVTSNSVSLPVAATGEACSDVNALTSADLLRFGPTPRTGIIMLNRVNARFKVPILGTLQGSIDNGHGEFSRFGQGALLASNAGAVAGADGLPSLGSCAVSWSPYDGVFSAAFTNMADTASRTSLEAGPRLTITGPKGPKPLNRVGNAQTGYQYGEDGVFLGGGIPGLPGLPAPIPSYLDAGEYTVDNGTGGADIGTFRATLTIPSNPPTWSNQDALTNIPRNQDLTVTWTGGDANGVVAIYATSGDPANKVVGQIACLERATAGRITIPAWMVSTLPVSGTDSGLSVGFLAFATTLSQPTRFQAPGLDLGFFNWANIQVSNVAFQ